MTEHTKDPWEFDPQRGYIFQRRDELTIYVIASMESGDDHLARRIVECVNALAGLNPSAVAALIEAAEEAFDLIGRPCSLEGLRDTDTVQIHPTVTIGQVKRFAAAIANIRGEQA